MDESEPKPEDIPVTESVTSTSQHVSDSAQEPDTGKAPASAGGTPATPQGPQGGSSKTSQSSASTDSSHQASSQELSAAPSQQTSGDGAGRQAEREAAQSPEAAESREAGGRRGGDEDGSLAGASSGQGAPPGEGAGGPSSSEVMAKMMAKGSSTSAMPKGSGDPKGDMMAKGGMPDMMAKGGMPDMMAKGGMPDMMAMMMEGGGGDMKAMMSKMKGGGPMGMAKLFDCIIDVSLAKPDSDSSDDDEDGISIEIPCQYCSRLFTSQMTLKTHILVAHEHEDSSVLNIKKLVIDKGKRGVKDHLGSRRKQSKDCEKSAAGSTNSLQQPAGSDLCKATAPQDDSWAAESLRGMKRGRRESGGRESGGAACVDEGGQARDQVPHGPVSGAVPSGCVTVVDEGGSPPESRKRSARLRSLRSVSGDGPSPRSTTKKSKSGDSDSSSQESSPPLRPSSRGARSGDEASSAADGKSQGSASEASKLTPQGSASEASKPTANQRPAKLPSPVGHAPAAQVKRVSRKDKDTVSSDTDIAAEAPPSGASPGSRGRGKGRQSSSVPAAGVKGGVTSSSESSPRRSDAAPASRRSLRSRLSH